MTKERAATPAQTLPGTDPEQFPIRVLSARTGVGASTLRAWERRYGVLVPQRTPKGHRLYTESDVRLVAHILTLLQEGHSLAAIARQVKRGEALDEDRQDLREQAGLWGGYIQATLQAVADFSSERIEAVFNDASSLHPMDMVTEWLIEPVLSELGRRWDSRAAGIAEEHFYASWVRNRLGARFHHASGQASGARIVCACAPGVHHEIGLMLFSIAALTRGYRVLYFGADLPLEQLPAIVDRSGARGVVLSSPEVREADLDGQLAASAATLGVPLLLGGAAGDEPLRRFEEAGGVRLGSRISVALRVLASHVPVHAGGRSGSGQ